MIVLGRSASDVYEEGLKGKDCILFLLWSVLPSTVPGVIAGAQGV